MVQHRDPSASPGPSAHLLSNHCQLKSRQIFELFPQSPQLTSVFVSYFKALDPAGSQSPRPFWTRACPLAVSAPSRGCSTSEEEMGTLPGIPSPRNPDLAQD